MNHLITFKKVWQLSLLSFIIAAVTGFLYRYGMLYPVPDSLNFANIRHAHSHLMFFNWVSPPIMIWIASQLISSSDTRTAAKFNSCFYVMIFLGFLSYPFFLFYGYHSVPIGSAALPLAAIISGLVMLTWYWFALLYFQHRTAVNNSLSFLFFDGALIALLISSLGAWGVSIFQFTPVDSPQISSAMTHFFLAVFTEGWAVLGVLGIMWQKAETSELPFDSGWLWQPILFGSMLIFPFSLSESVITPAMHYTAKFGTVLIAGSLTVNFYLLVKSGSLKGLIWKTILGLIALKILFQFAAVLPTGIWPGEHGLRVLYLHLLLLGIVSILLIHVFHSNRYFIAKAVFTISVLLVLLSLALISGYWPVGLAVPNLHFRVMIVAFLPIIPTLWIFWRDLLPFTSD